MTSLLTLPDCGDMNVTAVAKAIAAGTINRRMLTILMTSATGGSDATGAWTQRESFELLERGLVWTLRHSPLPAIMSDISEISSVVARLPTQTVRSEEQIKLQQFSTPADVAALIGILAQISPADSVLEPSAGNGLLVAQIPRPARLFLNELDADRRNALERLFPEASITGHDAEQLGSLMPADIRPTVVLMNPPFSRSTGRGADQHAAARHLQAALRRLAPNGRLVAIMPDWFAPNAAMGQIYETVLKDTTVRTSLRLEGAFLKHGTGIAVRLYVIDKRPGRITPTIIQRATVVDALDCIEISPRLPIGEGTAAAPRPKSTSLFRSMRKAKPAATRIVRPPVRNDILPVRYEAFDDARPLGNQVGVYLPYRPSRIAFASAGVHPTDLVESVAMGSIAAPKPNYIPHLPERTVSERMLSEPQLETLVYAGTAWMQYLPGTYTPDPKTVGLKIDEAGRSYRKGYFLGDGTGAGKGRQVAACILDNWLQGRRRNIWVSKNAALLEDAQRDWSALGGLTGDVQGLDRWKIDEPISMSEGILFVTYPMLRSHRQDHSRLQQMLTWAGPDFEGVIAFDEAHEMAGVAGGEGALGKIAGSQQGIAGVLLQNRLPDARVLYASATGASDVNNLAYATRLGLWGVGTAFADREQFITEIRAGGIAAMELIARDLKATGLYTSRALSFAGVEYDILKQELTPEQIDIYDAFANAWAIIHQHMEEALQLTNVVDALEVKTLNSGAKAAARSRFESTKQRFFGQLLLSMKLPVIISASEDHLAKGESVVVQLVTTAESILDRRLDGLSAEERANLEIDLSPREYVIDYLERAFPTRQMRVYTDDTGEQRSEPMTDSQGNPVHNPDAIAARDSLIEHLCALPAIKPALDALIEHFGTNMVAEVTGRTRRLIALPDGTQKVESRSARTSHVEAAAFMNGDKRILVFSDAGGTGRSYHASLDVENQQRRAHLLVEPGWRADRAIQGLGRTHRTHQACTPLFRPVTTDCKGELRFTSTIARRLDTLGALTRGQRQTGGQNLFDPADNLESEYAKSALNSWFHLLVMGKLSSTTLADFTKRSGLAITDKDGVMVDELPPIQRWLNRILAFPIGLQNSIFEEFLSLIETRIEAARKAGKLDVGVETIVVERATVADDIILRTDPQSGATTHLLTIDIEKRMKPVSLDRVLELARWLERAVFMRNKKSGRVALRSRARSLMEEDGATVKRFALERPTRTEYMMASEMEASSWEVVDEPTFSAAWNEEAAEAAQKTETSRIRIATGLLLPIWSLLPKDQMSVNRIVDNDGTSWLGRIVYEDNIPELLRKFGIDPMTKLSADDLAAGLTRAGASFRIERPFPMTVRSVRVNGSQRAELVDVPPAQHPWLKSLGCWTEIIAYKTRLFIPVDRTRDILRAITEV